jgi:TPR repeat protein
MKLLASATPQDEVQRRATAAFILATFYIDGFGVDVDIASGFQYLCLSAEMGDLRSKAFVKQFADCFESSSTSFSISNRATWTMEAAQAGSNVALDKLEVWIHRNFECSTDNLTNQRGLRFQLLSGSEYCQAQILMTIPSLRPCTV